MKSSNGNHIMGVHRVRLGDYIERSMVNNGDLKYGVDLIEGVTSEGIFAPPKGDNIDINLKPYKIVEKGAFVYNPSRLNLGSIAYRTEGLCIVSHLYVVFYLNEKGKQYIEPEYLFMYFRREEFYREVSFRNFGSQRPEFNFFDMCDILIPLPEIHIQRKFVAIYKAMVANQQSYEQGLNDLKLVSDALIEKYKHGTIRMPLGELLQEYDVRNSDNSVIKVDGVNKDKKFMPSVASSDDLSKYKLVEHGSFACNLMHIGRDVVVPIALNSTNEFRLVSPAYMVLKINNDVILSEYLLIWMSRAETDRRAWFMSDSSVRSGMEKKRFFEITVPVPSKEEQKALVEIYKVLDQRKAINEKLKAQIKDICPVLIRGSIEYGG